MENKKEPLVWKHKLPLDKEMAERISKFYSVNLPDDAIGVECFSHPSLTAHECNPAAKLAGGTECRFCQHIFERSCQITCNISRFCLVVFAYRIGLGGEDFGNAVEFLGKMDYEKLYQNVQERLADLEKHGPNAAVRGDLQLGIDYGKGNLPKKLVKDSPKNALASSRAAAMKKNSLVKEPKIACGDGEEELGEDWLTISEAALIYKCSYVNLYSHISKGNLKCAKIRGVKRVRKADVLRLKEMNGK